MTWDKYRHDLEVLVQVAETAGTPVTLSYREARKLLDRLDAAEEAVEAANEESEESVRRAHSHLDEITIEHSGHGRGIVGLCSRLELLIERENGVRNAAIQAVLRRKEVETELVALRMELNQSNIELAMYGQHSREEVRNG